METALAAAPDDPWRGHDGPARPGARAGHEPAVHGVLRERPGGRLSADRRRQRLSPGGLRGVRPQHPSRPPAVRRSRLPASGHGQAEEPRGPHPHVRDQVLLRRARGPSASRSHRGRRHGDGSWPGRSSSPAAPSTRRSSCCSQASGRPRTSRALGIPVVADLPGVGRHLQDHLEVYIQYKSLQPVSMQPSATQNWRRPFIGAQWLFLRSGPGATNHFEGGGFVRSNDDVAYPNLMFHFLPLAIRYDGSAGTPGPRLPGPRRADVLRRAGHRSRSRAPIRASIRRCASTTSRPTRTGASGSRPSASRGACSTSRRWRPYNGGETSPGPGVETDEEILEWVRRDAETALHPSCTARMGIDALSRHRSADDARPRRRRPARRGCLVDAVRHQRQHLRAGDDAGREGRRPRSPGTRRCRPSRLPFYRHGVSPPPG